MTGPDRKFEWQADTGGDAQAADHGPIVGLGPASHIAAAVFGARHRPTRSDTRRAATDMVRSVAAILHLQRTGRARSAP